jgi:hypothetical protein
LDAITTAATGVDVTFSKVGGANKSETDLKNIATITGVDSFKVEADTAGIDIVQLSSTLSTSGKTTVDLKSGDNAVDKLIFNVDKANYLSEGGNAISYTTVNQFDAGSDQYALYYTGFPGDSASGTYGTELIRSTIDGGSFNAPLLADKLYVEDDANSIAGTKEDFNTVTEVKARIGAAISNSSTDANRLKFVSYFRNPSNGDKQSFLTAADFTNVSGKTDVTKNDQFNVVGIANFVGVSRGAMGAQGNVEDSLTTKGDLA